MLMSANPSNVSTSGFSTVLPPVTGSAAALAVAIIIATAATAANPTRSAPSIASSRFLLFARVQTTNLPSSCRTSPSTSNFRPRRRSQTRSVWTALSLTPPDSG